MDWRGEVNRFRYVDASPLNFTDPRGLNPTTADGLGFGFVYDEQGTLISEYGAGGAKSV